MVHDKDVNNLLNNGNVTFTVKYHWYLDQLGYRHLLLLIIFSFLTDDALTKEANYVSTFSSAFLGEKSKTLSPFVNSNVNTLW